MDHTGVTDAGLSALAKLADLQELDLSGPKITDVLRLVIDLTEQGTGICVPGNHDIKLMRKLKGRDVKITHGLAESLEQIEREGSIFQSTNDTETIIHLIARSRERSLPAALVHALCAFVASAAFFSLATLLSTSFSDIWRPLLIACAVAVVLWLAEQVIRDFSPYSIFTVMNGEKYFRSGQLPWAGLVVAASLSAAMLYGAAMNIERRDF